MVDENASPRGSLVEHLGVNGVENESRFLLVGLAFCASV